MTVTEIRLVSIIVRSMGRPMLGETLAAIACQTYPSIEVLVVDATGGKHALVPSRCGPFAVIFVAGSEQRPRPIAANAGLDAAHGTYIGLLDDDDLIEPTHIEGLVKALEAKPEYALAYSLAREINANGDVVGRRDTPYSRLLLFQDCYVMPSAALFRSTVRECCRFDEQFDVCEDWDFWLQIARLSNFLRVPQDTAIYRSDLGQSGMGQGANRDLDKFFRYRDLLAAKWREEGERFAAAVLPLLQADFERAQSDFARGDTQTAETRASAILGQYPHHVGALTLLGTLKALRGDYKGAVVHFEWAVNVKPDDPGIQFNLAQALERLGLLDAARSRYMRVIALQPEHPHARSRLASIELQTRATKP